MRNINFKGLGTKVAGMAGGVVAAGFVQKGVAKLGWTGNISDLAVLAVGALGPDLLGKKSPIITAGGDAIMALAIRGLLKTNFPTLPIAGVDDVAGLYDNVAGADGYGDYEVGEVDEAGFVAGPDDEAGDVSGVGANSL